MLRKTFAVVDLSKIAHNIRVLEKDMGAGVMAMAVVKANAYGHGWRKWQKWRRIGVSLGLPWLRRMRR